MAAPILNNPEAEQLILDIRVGRAAARAALDDRAGGFVVFPTSIVVAVPGRGHNVFPLRTAVEPGTPCHTEGASSVTGNVNGVTVKGRFWWSLVASGEGSVPPPMEEYRFVRGNQVVARPPWADQLPRSQTLMEVTPSSLIRLRLRLVRRGRSAEHELLSRTAKVFERCCRGPLRRALAVRPELDVADVVQRSMQVAGRLLPLYASADRPPCSWLGMIKLDGRRDLHRAITQMDWLPHDLVEVIGRVESADIVPHEDPTVTLAAIIEAAVVHRQTLPRASAGQVAAALATPRLVPLDTRPGAAAVEGADVLGRLDPDLEAAEDERGALAAAVARVVVAEPSLVAQAWLGDDRVLDRIGDRVIAGLRRPGESKATTRQRCRREFQAAGRLFSSAEGLRCFGGHAPPRQLAHLDAGLAALVCRVTG